MKLQIELKSNRSQRQELEVKSLARQLASIYCTSIESFERCFNEDILKLKRTNNFQHSFFFKIYREATSIELWKLNLQGEKNRLIMIITETNN
jgi:hypothetical protein